jgi:hypothetical protein
VEVRLEIVGSLARSSSKAAALEIARLLADADQHVRLDTLRLIGRTCLRAAAPELGARIHDAAFHNLEISERRHWIETLSLLDRGRTEALVIELLESRPLIPSANIEQTRELAADWLATATTPKALEVLRAAAKTRWWNTPPVREAAARALVVLEARSKSTPSSHNPGSGQR